MGKGINRIRVPNTRWHDLLMKTPTMVLLLVIATSGFAADPVPSVAGRILGESGQAIEGAAVTTGGRLAFTDAAGSFETQVDEEGPVLLHVHAAGYYDAVQAFGPADLERNNWGAGDIELVARREGRRLLMFAGDSMLARRYFSPRAGESAIMRRSRIGQDGAELLQVIKPYVELADYASVNLETQLSSQPLKNRLPKLVTFYSPPELPALLQSAGFDYVALGNNHTWDYQQEGLASTFAALDQTNLGYSGAGLDEASARKAYVTDIDQQSFGFLSYVGWPGTFKPSQAADEEKGGAALGSSAIFAEDLSALPDESVAVLQYHSGIEYSAMPAMSERTRLRQAVDDGADIAIGHHVHVLQGLEIFKDRLIAYSMGNFLFDQYHYTTQLGMLLYVWMDGDKLHRAEVVPMHVNGYVPTPATDAMRYSVLHRLARLSRPFDTCLRANGAHAVVETCGKKKSVRLDLESARLGIVPVPLRALGMSAVNPVSIGLQNYSYRLGTDILRHGDFEYSGLFGTQDRAWLLPEGVAVNSGESRQLSVSVPRDKRVRTGMKVFERIFTSSNPTTLSGRIHTDGPVVVRFLLQRRRIDDRLDEALEGGPTTAVGGVRITGSGWHNFSLDFDQPRLTTRSVRLLIEIAADKGRELAFDDMTWIEWRTPWLDGDDANTEAEFATHVQFRQRP